MTKTTSLLHGRSPRYHISCLSGVIVLTFVALLCNVATTGTLWRFLLPLRVQTRVDPQFNATSSFISLWASAWTDYSALRDAPLGNVLADLVQALHQHQNPADCANARYLIFEYETPLGFGAQIRHILVAFYLALQTDRVFILNDDKNFYWGNGCPDGRNNKRFACHFRPLSETCPFAKIKELIKSRKIHALDANYSSADWIGFGSANGDTPSASAMHLSQKKMGTHFRDFLHSFPHQNSFVEQVKRLIPFVPLHSLNPDAHARRLWLSAATFYMIRPNSRVAKHVRNAVEQVLMESGMPGPPRLIGAPVRASDKCYSNIDHPGPGEMTCVTLEDTAETVMRLALMQPELTHVIITSEDTRAISEVGVSKAFDRFPFRKPLHVVRFAEDVRPGTGDTNRALKKLGKKQAELLDSMLVVLHLQALAYVLHFSFRTLRRYGYDQGTNQKNECDCYATESFTY